MSNTGFRPAIALFRRPAGATAKDIAGQRALIEACAARQGCRIAFEYTYVGASHEDLIASRAYVAMLEQIAAKKALTVIVATATTLDTDPLVQAVAAARLRKQGVTLIVADACERTLPATSAKEIVDRVFEVSERFDTDLARIEESRLKIGPARRKNYVEMFPEAVSLAKAWHQRSLRDGVRRSLRELSAMLARQGHLNNAGNPYHPDEVRRMMQGPDPLHIAGSGA